VLFYHHLIEN